MMDCVIPGSVDMTKVKFDAQGEDECKHNFRLLHEAFSKSGITKVRTFHPAAEQQEFFVSFSVTDAFFCPAICFSNDGCSLLDQIYIS